MRRLVISVTILALLVTAVSVFAQGDTEDVAMVRVFHASPGAGEVDIFVNGERSDIQALDFGDMTPWAELAPGSYDIAVVPTGEDLEDAVITLDGVSLAAGDWATIAAAGSVEVGDAFLQVIVEDFSEIVFGETRLTVFHGVPNLGPINVQLDDGTVLIQTLAFPQSLGENDGAVSLDIIAGPRTIQITPFDDSQTILISLDNVVLASGKNNFVAVIGLASDMVTVMVPTNPADLSETVVEDEEVETGVGPLHARLFHAAPGAGGVDVYVNGVLAEPSFFFGEITDFAEMPAGVYTVTLVPVDGEMADAILEAEVPLVAGEYMTVIAYGSVELGMADVMAVAENFDELGAGEARISFQHLIPNAGPLNLQLDDGTVLAQTVGYPGTLGDNNGYVSVDLVTRPRIFQITPYDDPTTVLFEVPAAMLAGDYYYIAVAGLSGDAVTVVTNTRVSDME